MMIHASVPFARSHDAMAASEPAPSPSAFRWVVKTARLEASIALGALIQRFPTFEPLDGQDVEWWDTPFLRGPKSYVVTF